MISTTIMQLNELPLAFKFVFISELNGAGYVFKLTKYSANCYLAADLQEWLEQDFDECMNLLRFKDLSNYALHQIDLPVLQRIKYQELAEANQLKDLTNEDRLIAKYLHFDQSQ